MCPDPAAVLLCCVQAAHIHVLTSKGNGCSRATGGGLESAAAGQQCALLSVPAPKGHSQCFGPKFDFSSVGQGHVSQAQQHADCAAMQPPVLALNPNAPISAYLSRYTVRMCA